jgi:aspartate carbamoyltransferase catalytic subunit
MRESLEGKLMYAIFYEPSTRTRFSFSTAATHLGMTVHATENASQFSSAVKGETLSDTIRVLCGYYPDVIVLRHHLKGEAEKAAEIVDRYGYNTTIINAGDGRGQHPTQSLLDVYTIQDERGSIDGATVTVGGDLKNGRTARSLAYLLGKFKGVKVIFFSPSNLRVGRDILAYLKRHHTLFEETSDMRHALSNSDVVYWTRVQKERNSRSSLDMSIGLRQMEWMRKDAVLLHPLPRDGEITEEVDGDPRAAYFRQAENGLFLRMALLQKICGK